MQTHRDCLLFEHVIVPARLFHGNTRCMRTGCRVMEVPANFSSHGSSFIFMSGSEVALVGLPV